MTTFTYRSSSSLLFYGVIGEEQEGWKRACERLNGGIAVVRSRRDPTWRAGVLLEIAGGGKDLMEV